MEVYTLADLLVFTKVTVSLLISVFGIVIAPVAISKVNRLRPVCL